MPTTKVNVDRGQLTRTFTLSADMVHWCARVFESILRSGNRRPRRSFQGLRPAQRVSRNISEGAEYLCSWKNPGWIAKPANLQVELAGRNIRRRQPSKAKYSDECGHRRLSCRRQLK